jgi:hypothetical protein
MNCLTHQLEYIESWGERDSREPDIMWCNHMALVTVRIRRRGSIRAIAEIQIATPAQIQEEAK